MINGSCTSAALSERRQTINKKGMCAVEQDRAGAEPAPTVAVLGELRGEGRCPGLVTPLMKNAHLGKWK